MMVALVGRRRLMPYSVQQQQYLVGLDAATSTVPYELLFIELL